MHYSVASGAESHRESKREMLDPTSNMLLPPPSPSNSSASTSDLDTQSTGSFFHDRSTTLGYLMGVTFPSITHGAPCTATAATGGNPSTRSKKKKKKRKVAAAVAERQRRRRWWSLCREGETKPASLGEFLEVERRFGDVALYCAGASAQPRDGVGGRLLFADGRILPPVDVDSGTSTAAGALCGFADSIFGICNGGVE